MPLLYRKTRGAARGLEIALRHIFAQALIAFSVPDLLERIFVDVADRRVRIAIGPPIAARSHRSGAVDHHLLPGDVAARIGRVRGGVHLRYPCSTRRSA